MIGKLTGNIDEIYEDYLILDVSGVGYQIFVSSPTLHHCSNISNVSLFIETHVREDHIHLYGFLSIEDKNAFGLLQTVSGIGSKVALNVLSQLSTSDIQGAIDSKDKTIFSRVSGIGPKLAERMLLELKGKTFSHHSAAMPSSAVRVDFNIVEDASQALINLGINRNEALNLVKNIMQNAPNTTIDQVIRIALQSRR